MQACEKQTGPAGTGPVECGSSAPIGMADRRRGLSRIVGRLDTAKAQSRRHRECIEQACERDPDALDFLPKHRHRSVLQQLYDCSSWVTIRDYCELGRYAVSAVRCRHHLVCPTCAIFRGSRILAATLERLTAARRLHGLLRPYLLTLTMLPDADLGRQLDRLQRAWSSLWRNRMPARRHPGNPLQDLAGGLRSVEVKRGRGGHGWHTHLHALVLADGPLGVERDRQGAYRWPAMSRAWERATGAKIVECHPVTPAAAAATDPPATTPQLLGEFDAAGDLVSACCEVAKYAVKLQAAAVGDLVNVWRCCRRRRLVESFGCLRGIDRTAEVDQAAEEQLRVELARYVLTEYAWTAGGYRLDAARLVDPIPY